MNILKLVRCGMDFRADDELVKGSDIGNYRVCTPFDSLVLAKNGREYFLEFLRADKWNYRTTHKVTGKPLKYAHKELTTDNAAHLSASYWDEEGNCYNDVALWRKAWEQTHPYTVEGILDIVNSFSATHYDAIMFVR